MTLDPCPSDAELLRRHDEQQRKRAATFAVRDPLGHVKYAVTNVTSGVGSFTNGAIVVADWLMPITLRIPWSALCSDNRKYGVIKGRMLAQKDYRTARKAIRALAVETMNGRPAADIPLRLIARVYVPDNRVHDVVNFSKAVHDALKGTVFTDDRWLYDARWIRAGVDVDAPRCELTISPLPEVL